MERFIAKWKGVVGQEDLDEFETGKGELYQLCPQGREYMETWHWKNERLFAVCYTKVYTTLGLRGTSRVESFNSALKGMFGVSSKTDLETLFTTLQYASIEVDRLALRVAATHATRVPPAGDGRTIDQEIHPHLTYYAGAMVKQQFALQHNYHVEQKTVAGCNSKWSVWDRRPISGTAEKPREVQVGDDYMMCSCCFTVTYLLPCRHVLALNLHLFQIAFRHAQVGRRWLRYHRVAPSAQLPAQQPHLPLPPAAAPSFLTSNLGSTALPGRSARYGQLMGYCNTICNRATEYKEAFFPMLRRLQALAAEAEALTSLTGEALALASPASSPSAAPVMTELHPSVAPEQLQLPEHRRKQPGREKQSRQRSQVETTKKKAKISASQQ